MFLVAQFDKHINAHYNMNVVNQRKIKSFRKVGGQGMNKFKKQREKHMSNKECSKYIFWIVLSVIIVSTLTGI
jgi:hypothetical protein